MSSPDELIESINTVSFYLTFVVKCAISSEKNCGSIESFNLLPSIPLVEALGLFGIIQCFQLLGSMAGIKVIIIRICWA